MGCPCYEPEIREGNDRYRVTLTQGFWLGIHAVTQAQWEAVMGANPARFKGANRPVEMVSWEDCQEYMEKLGRKTGAGFRLPTEAEWEYACLAGTTTAFFCGKTLTTDQANYNGSDPMRGLWADYNLVNNILMTRNGTYRKKTTPVGSFMPNAWNLYDMHGNVDEWCADLYEGGGMDDVSHRYDHDRPIPVRVPTRMIRGGSWQFDADSCRAAYRDHVAPSVRNDYLGFRLVLVPCPK